MRLDAEYEKKSVSFWSEAIESMHLRVILNSPVSTGLTPRHCERSEESLNTSLRGRSPWQFMEGVC